MDHPPPTGNYTPGCYGAVFEKKIQVEIVMPNRLKINLDFGKDAWEDLGKKNQYRKPTGCLGGWKPESPAVTLNHVTLSGIGWIYFPKPHFILQYTQQNNSRVRWDETGHGQIKPDFAIDDDAPGNWNANPFKPIFDRREFQCRLHECALQPIQQSYAGLKLPDGEKTV